ncbi:MAG: manganese transporter [Phototrophicales bacterium]|nr:MAG: manganese transporter [Phototrophicales bacterium]
MGFYTNLKRVMQIFMMVFMVLAPTHAQSAPLRIVATTTQATDLIHILTNGVSDQYIHITGLMGAGVDPHLYKPTVADIEAMNQADMIVYSGLHLEGQFDAVFESVSQRGVKIHRLAQPVIDAGYVLKFDENGIATDDPHFWFDPRNWALATQALADRLADIDPIHAAIYLANAKAYIAQLDAFYAWGVEAMHQVPAELRYIVTSHDAFRYFGDAFGWTMVGIQGISTASEVGVGDIQAVVNFVIEKNIPVIFVESSVPPATIRAVQEAVISNGGRVNVGVRELYSDAMGEPDTFGGTYIGMIAANIYTLLQSYQLAGVELTIPEWNALVMPTPPDELFEIN